MAVVLLAVVLVEVGGASHSQRALLVAPTTKMCKYTSPKRSILCVNKFESGRNNFRYFASSFPIPRRRFLPNIWSRKMSRNDVRPCCILLRRRERKSMPSYQMWENIRNIHGRENMLPNYLKNVGISRSWDGRYHVDKRYVRMINWKKWNLK